MVFVGLTASRLPKMRLAFLFDLTSLSTGLKRLGAGLRTALPLFGSYAADSDTRATMLPLNMPLGASVLAAIATMNG